MSFIQRGGGGQVKNCGRYAGPGIITLGTRPICSIFIGTRVIFCWDQGPHKHFFYKNQIISLEPDDSYESQKILSRFSLQKVVFDYRKESLKGNRY